LRKIIFFRDYFLDFYKKQNDDVQKKIEWTLGLLRNLERIPEKYFKHVTDTDGLYEIRVHAGPYYIRIFSCFDKNQIIILLNGFQKKSNKTPKKEIDLALSLMKEYFNEKK
jgi:phage-related protein